MKKVIEDLTLKEAKERKQIWHCIDVIKEREKRLETIDKLQEELGCPLEVMVWLFKNKPILVLNPVDKAIQVIEKPMKYFDYSISAFDIRNEKFKSTYETNVWTTGGVIFPLNDYKKTWWLKEDKEE